PAHLPTCSPVTTMPSPQPSRLRDALLAPVATIGAQAISMVDHMGSAVFLLWDTLLWAFKGAISPKLRLGKAAVISQIVRVGVRSIFIVSLVSGCVGLILAFQLSPPLDDFGRKDLVANIISIAVLRELGPLIGAIVLTGFAGASIAAEIGTMVVSEEVEALEAHALNPVRFLVVPRLLAAVLSMTCLAIIASVVSIASALAISVVALDIPFDNFMRNMLDQAKLVDFATGVSKGAVFGLLIGTIACLNGLKVSGGAAGVGKATTSTVVQCVVAIVIADLAFTAVFFAVGLV
ncbi:MAG: MlaE family ABC transporter permease, partial [Phycisphaerae bacterium]